MKQQSIKYYINIKYTNGETQQRTFTDVNTALRSMVMLDREKELNWIQCYEVFSQINNGIGYLF